MKTAVIILYDNAVYENRRLRVEPGDVPIYVPGDNVIVRNCDIGFI